MALIHSVNQQTQVTCRGTPVVNHLKISIARPIPRLFDVLLSQFALQLYGLPLDVREVSIQGYQLPNVIKMMLNQMNQTLKTIEDRLMKCRSDEALHDVRALCFVQKEGQEKAIYSRERYNAYFKAIVKKVAEKKSHGIFFRDFQCQDLLLKEILGDWYVCIINNEQELASICWPQTFITKIRFSHKIGDEKKVAESLKGNRSLTSLFRGGNGMRDADASILAAALREYRSLTSLGLNDNQIGDEGAIAISKALTVNTSLANLNLHGNRIGCLGASAFADALKVNTSLTSLSLGGNQIEALGTLEIAGALKVNIWLTSLDLCANKVGDEGAIKLAEVLKEETSLTSLNLDRNEIGDEGATALAEVFKGKTLLTSFSLDCNQIGDEGAIALAKAIKGNTFLISLFLELNQIGDAGAIALGNALTESCSLSHVSIAMNKEMNDEIKSSIRKATYASGRKMFFS